jgi:alkylation response protein AidB-like acyl-CoA dehydrogenase
VFIPDVVSDEHAQLRSTVRSFLERRASEADVRRVVDGEPGHDPVVWKQMATELGLQGLGIPEDFGGSGFGAEETTIVHEELGRALLPSPFFPTVALAAPLLLQLRDVEAQKEWLPGIADGTLIATVALDEDDQQVAPASGGAGEWRLTGERRHVLAAVVADLLLVVVDDDAGRSVFAVRADAPGLTVTPLETLDLTRRQAAVRFHDVPAVLVGEHGAAAEAVSRTRDLAAVALAAEQAGGAGRLMQMSLEYAKLRYQFGRQIGSFQAIKHKLADMALDVERMDSVVRHAATIADRDVADLPVVAHIAKVFCSEAYFRIAAENIQVHGGIGFTWEHPAHLYFRRAKSSEFLLGSPSAHRERLLAALGV